MSPETFFEKFAFFADASNGIQKLRGMILQLAIQGKLVPQDPDDEPASVLSKKIKAEKLIIEKKIKRDKPIVFHEEKIEPYDLPLGWKWSKIGEIIRFEYGKGLPKSIKNKTGPIPVYGANGIKRYCIEALIDQPSIIIGRKGSAGAFNRVYTPCWPLDVTYYVQPSKHLDFEYVYYCLKSLGLENMARGIKPGLNRNEIYALTIGLPPKKEQSRIVNKIKQLMSLCDELEARKQKRVNERIALNNMLLNKLLSSESHDEFQKYWQHICDNFDMLYDNSETVDKLRQTVFQLAARGKLVPQDPNDEAASGLLKRLNKKRLAKEKKIKKTISLPPVQGNEIPYSPPHGWEWVRLCEIGEFCGGGTPSKNHSAYWGGNIPWVSPKDMKSDRISTAKLFITQKALDETSVRLIPENSLLIVARSGILKRLLPVAINDIKCTVNQDIKVIIPFDTDITNYLQLMLKGHQDMILNQLVKAGVTVQSLKYKEFEVHPFPIPPLAEQRRIISKVTQLMSFCDNLEYRVQQAQSDINRILEQVTNDLTGMKESRIEKTQKDSTLKNSDKQKERILETSNEINRKATLILSERIKKLSKDELIIIGEDMKAILAEILRKNNFRMTAKELWRASGLEIDDFYAQLKTEVDEGLIREPERKTKESVLEMEK